MVSTPSYYRNCRVARITGGEAVTVATAARPTVSIRVGPPRRVFSTGYVLLVVLLGPPLATGHVRAQGTALETTTDVSPTFAKDFEALWEDLNASYAYFDEKTADWDSVRTCYAEEVDAVTDEVQFLNFLERMLEELYDFHITLNLHNDESPAQVPRLTDCWAEMRDGRPIVTAVRPATPAARAGVRPGMEILAIDGRPLLEALRDRLGRCGARGDPLAIDWALVAMLAGHGTAMRRLTLADGDARLDVELEPCPREGGHESLLEHRVLDENVGFVRFHDSLGDNATIAAFDEALEHLGDTAGLILDLRDTPSGGNTTVARGIMGRLVATEAGYQKHELPFEQRDFGVRRTWLELVAPRGPQPYAGPVVVLVDRWTASMGEGLAIGLDGLGRATVVGTPMAGLLGGTRSFTLPDSGIVVRYPGEKLFHVDGTPRSAWVPPVLVAVSEDGGDDDREPILEAGLSRIRAMLGVAEQPEERLP
jgi:C-terminal processing protease CtpA/Prc